MKERYIERVLRALPRARRAGVRRDLEEIFADSQARGESEAQVLAAFPGARLVQIEGEAFADEFALVTALGQEDALLDAAEQLAQALPCGAPIRYLTL